MAVTFVLTRYPLVEFHWNGMSGRWGELIAIKGPKVHYASVSSTKKYLGRAPGYQRLDVGDRCVHMSTDGAEVTETLRYTTMERFRANSNNEVYYVRLPPRTDPYVINVEYNNPIVKRLRPGHDGRCFRIHGAKTLQEQAILIHEAPNVSYLIGCISPRPLNERTPSLPNNPTSPPSIVLNRLIQFAGNQKADLFVSHA